MAKGKLKNLIKLIATCVIAAVFTVIAVVYFVQDNAYAWFSQANEVNANGLEITINVDNSVVDGSSPPEYFNFTQKSDNSYTFEKSEYTEMETYDSSINNDYQIVIKIKLTAAAECVTVNAYSTADKYLGADDAGALASSGNSMSSVVAFEIYYSDSDSSVISETVSDGTTTAVTLIPPESLEEYSFVNKDKTLSTSVKLNDTHELTGTGNKAVYLVIKYHANAIDEIISHNIGNDVFSGDTNIAFNCDFYFSIS